MSLEILTQKFHYSVNIGYISIALIFMRRLHVFLDLCTDTKIPLNVYCTKHLFAIRKGNQFPFSWKETLQTKH